jgi:hypothetical protein
MNWVKYEGYNWKKMIQNKIISNKENKDQSRRENRFKW